MGTMGNTNMMPPAPVQQEETPWGAWIAIVLILLILGGAGFYVWTNKVNTEPAPAPVGQTQTAPANDNDLEAGAYGSYDTTSLDASYKGVK